MVRRKGLGIGLGKGYKNIVPIDPMIHGLSAKGVKTRTLFLQPLNEGQELNYIETHKGNIETAMARAKDMKIHLDKALPQGTIDVEILNKDFNRIKIVT